MKRASLCVVLCVLVGCGGVVDAPKKKPPSREDFKKAVMGKTKAEVLELLGKPESTSGVPDSSDSWVYPRATYDPVADKPDARALVIFSRDGIVKDVMFGSY